MLTDRIENLIKSLNTTSASIDATDSIIFFDESSSKFYVIENTDYKKGYYDFFIEIRRLSDLNSLGEVYFANPDSFIAKYPDSELEKYILSAHKEKVLNNINKYATAYAKLYICYKSLAVLTKNDFSDFIDSFIDACFRDKTDHPATFCYFGNEPYKILKLRKAVFNIYEPYLHNYDVYRYIYELQSRYNYTDKQLRKVKKELLGKAEPDLCLPKKKESKSGLVLIA